MNSYWDRGLERVPTIYSDLEEIINKYPNSIIATTACIGGELSQHTLKLIEGEKTGDKEMAATAHNNIVNFVLWCKKLFGKDFYIECAPGCSKDQIIVNQRLRSIAQAFDVKMVIGSDSHYLKKEDRYVHKSYLNSKGGEREVDEFYEYAYLQSNEQEIEHLSKSNFDESFIQEMWNNSHEIYDKIENYSLAHKQTIPHVEVKDYPKIDKMKSYPVLNSMFNSDDKIERYWVNECINKLEEIGKNEDNYLNRLEEEADIKRTISEKLETNMFAYPVTLQHYVDLFWECGSIVGAGRGSSCSGLNHYLLGITQLDPLQWNLPF
jgi:DNA polymerase-3 subunit alpha